MIFTFFNTRVFKFQKRPFNNLSITKMGQKSEFNFLKILCRSQLPVNLSQLQALLINQQICILK